MNEKVKVFKDKTNFTSDEFLHINSCGFTTDKVKNHIFRPKGRVDIFISLIRKGSTLAKIGNETTIAGEGEVLLYLKDEPQDYIHLPKPISETCWVHFCGTVADELIKKAGITASGKYVPVSPAETERLFRLVIRHNLAGDDISALSYLMRLVSSISPNNERSDSTVRRLIRKEAENIAVKFTEEVDLDQAADRCNISRTRFTHLFTEIMGISPRKMQTSLRIEKARELLAYSDLSVYEISEQCGYSDPLYFSRLFTKNCSVSPSEFRKGFKK